MYLHRAITTSFLIFLLTAGGCGYHFSGAGPGPQPGLDRLAVPMFENLTGQPGLEAMFTTALRREFNARSSMKLVPSDEAQMILQGRITQLTTVDVAHRTADQTIESQLTVTLDVRCVSVADGSTLWRDPNMSYFQEYFQSQDPNVSSEDRRNALEYIARQMALRIHDRFLSGF
jgi:hypothetical protein